MSGKIDETDRFVVGVLTNELVAQTAGLLNSEWPRSLHQRCESLKALVGDPNNERRIPTSLVLSDALNDNRVVGHASLVSISTLDHKSVKKLVFLQSLVVDKGYRGKGLGKKLMTQVEKYLIDYRSQPNRDDSIDLEYVYLNTKDKQGFYTSLGYEPIEAISFFTNRESSRCTEIMKSLLKSSATEQASNKIPSPNNTPPIKPGTGPVPPPPPPILPQPKSVPDQLYWFRKRLS